ncbi:MAG: class I SAM-dependent methyltransferase [Anaerolineales bacterium]
MPDLRPATELPSFYELQTATGWRQMLAAFARWCQPQPGWRVLDAGSGPGALAANLAAYGCQSTALDRLWRQIQPALHMPMILGDVYALPFADGAFDLVAASNLLFLLPEPERAVKALHRVLKPGGILAMLNPSEQMSLTAAQALATRRQLAGAGRTSLLNYARRAEQHARWSEQDVCVLFEAAGLQLQRTELRMGPGLVRFAAAA